MERRWLPVVVTLLCSLLVATSFGYSVPRQRQFDRLLTALDKRLKEATPGNPCPDMLNPFPCKQSSKCLPMSYICDSNVDCEDGYDENEELCAAANRPPMEDVVNFLTAEKDWIVDKLFAGRNIVDIAHALIVSQKVDDFSQRLGLSSEEAEPLKEALEAIEAGDSRAMRSFGMPPSEWKEVSFIFSKLINSGFTE